MHRRLGWGWAALVLCCAAACQQNVKERHGRESQAFVVPNQGGGIKYGIGGQVNNSVANSWVKLQLGNEVIKVVGSNRFTFPNQYLTGTHYAVTLNGNAPATGCAIANGIGVLTATVTDINVTCGAPTQATGLALAGFPAVVLAGAGGNMTVTATLGGGGTSFDYRGVVKFTSTDPNAILPAPYQYTANDGGVHVFTGVFSTSGVQAIFVNDQQAGLGASQGGINVGAEVIYYLQVDSFPSPVNAGQQANVTVTARDQYGNIATGYLGTVAVTSSDPNAILPLNATFGAGNTGIKLLPVTLTTAGLQSINANDLSRGALPGTQTNILVNPNAPYQIQVGGFPTVVTAGQVATVNTVLYDAYGNIVTTFRGTMKITSTDPNAALPAPYNFSAGDAGAHSFQVTLVTAGKRNIIASDANAPGVLGQESNIIVNPNVAVAVSVHNYPATVTAGQKANAILTAYDAYGNVATGYAGTVSLSSACPNTTIAPASVTFVPAVNNGNATVPVTFTKAGICAINPNGPGLATNAAQGNILVNPNIPYTLHVYNFPNPATAGVQGNVTVAALDAYGNIATGFTDRVGITASDPNAVLPGQRTYSVTDAGIATFPVTLETAGLQWINANDVTTPGILGQQGNILVNPGPTTHLALSGYPSPVVAGTQGNITMVALDNYNNVTPAYADTVQLGVNDPNALYPVTATFIAAYAGVMNVPVTMLVTGTWHIDANDVSTASIAGEQNGIVVNPNAATGFVVTNFPSPVNAGTTGNVNLTAYDAYGNIATGYTGSVGFAYGDPNVQGPAGYTFTGPDQGRTTQAVTFYSSGTWYIDANDTATPTIAGAQNTIIVNPGNANRLKLTGFSSPIVAGTPNQVTVTAYDRYGNVATGYTGQVTFTSTDPIATLPGDYAFGGLGVDNGTHAFTATLKAAGNQNIMAADTLFAALAGSQNSIVVLPADANYFNLQNFPTPIGAGTAANVTVTARDVYGNLATGYAGTVVISTTDPNAPIVANTAFTGLMGQANITIKLVSAGLRNINANDQATPAIAGSQVGIEVDAGSPNFLRVFGYPASVAAGSPNTVTVAAYDMYNNLVKNFTDTVTFASSDPNAQLPGATAFGMLDAGSKSFTGTFYTGGNQNILVIDGNATAVRGVEPNILVNPAGATRFAVSGYPATAVAGQQANITITAYDAYNNLATNYAGEAKIVTNDANALINPNDFNYIVANAGVAHASVTLVTVGTRYVQVSDASNFSITGQEANIVISPNVASYLTLTNFPSPTVAGVQGNVVVTAYDAYNNVATGYTGTVSFTSTDGNAVLSPNITFTGANQGVHLASFALSSSGTQSITGNDTVTPKIAGTDAILVVKATSVNHFTVTGFPNPTTAGQQGNITVTAYDSFNNVVTAYTGTIQVTSSDTNARLPANRVFNANDNGAVTLPVQLLTSGMRVISANDTTSPSITGNQNSIVVNPNIAVKLKATGFPATINAGQAANITITAYDIYANVATGYTGTVKYFSSDTNAVLPGNSVFPGTGGNVQVPVTLRTTGVWSISGNDIATPSLNSVQRNIVVNANNANHLTITGFPATSIAGQMATVTITAYDDFNNIATGYTGTVGLFSNDPNAALPANHIFTSTDAGMATMRVALDTNGKWYINANDTVTATLNAGQQNLVVSPNAAAVLRVAGFPASVNAGQLGNIVVTAYDVYGNLATTSPDTIRITSTDPIASLPANATLAVSGNVTFSSIALKTAGNQNIMATDLSNSAVFAGSQNVIAVGPLSPNHLTVSGFANPTVAGQPNIVHVVAYDIYNNIVPAYAGTVVTTSTDANAILPSNYGFNATNAGAANITVTLVRAGYQNITVTDNANAFLMGSQNNILVNPNVPARLAFVTSPNDANVCAPLSASVQIFDNANNLCTNTNVTVSLNWVRNPNNAWLKGVTTRSTNTGVVVFPNLGANYPARNLALSANATGIPAALGGNFNVFTSAPRVTYIGAPSNSNTAVAIPYYVSDACADNANIKVEVWTTPIGDWNRAVAAVGTPYGLQQTPTGSLPSGKALTYWWDSSRVLRNMQDTNVWVRITPTTRDATGPTLVYGPFTVDNRMTFTPTYARASAATISACILADINKDGKIDALNGFGAGGKVNFNINNGAGNFDTEYVNSVASPYIIAVGDFNRDGRIDLAAAQTGSTTVNVVYFNKTTATGGTRTVTIGSTPPAALAVADFNLDGYLDIAGASATDNNITMVRGTSGGNFQTIKPVTTLPATPAAMVVADIDRNGRPDLVVTSTAGNAVYVLPNEGAGFFAVQTLSNNVAPLVTRVADVDHDGSPDLVTLNAAAGTVYVRPGDGNGLFFANAMFAIGTISGGADLQVVDLDNDSYPEIAVLTSANAIAVHKNMTRRTFAAYTLVNGAGTYSGTTAGTSRALCAGDVNLDGRADLYVAADQVSWTAINATPRSTNVRLAGQPVHLSGAEVGGVTLADVNQDGIPDLVTSDPTNSALSMVIGIGADRMNPNIILPVTGYPRQMISADINHDKIPDFIAASDTTNNILVFTGTGAAGVTQQTALACGGIPRDVITGDLNHDGHLDIVAAVPSTNLLWRFLGQGNGSFSTGTSYAIGTNPNSLVLADFDKDGNLDVATALTGDTKIATMSGVGDGTFTSLHTFATDAVPTAIAAGYANADAYLDLYAVTATPAVDVFTNTTAGSFNAYAAATGLVVTNPYILAVVDLNRDGVSDIVVYNNSRADGMFISYMNTSLAMTSWEERGMAGFSNSGPPRYDVKSADINGDGWPDLLVPDGKLSFTVTPRGGVSLLYNSGIGVTLPATGSSSSAGTVYMSPSYPPSAGYLYTPTNAGLNSTAAVVAADFNQDGNMDFAQFAANPAVLIWPGTGTGTFSASTSLSVPSSSTAVAGLVAGDINNDGWADLISTGNNSTFSYALNARGPSAAGFRAFQTMTAPGAFSFAGPVGAAIGDLNRDGSPDFLFGSGSAYMTVMTDGNLILSAGTSAAGTRFTALGDLNGDGILDAVLGNTGSTFAIRQGDGAGGWATSTTAGSTTQIGYVVDLDNDGDLDILAANRYGGTPVAYWVANDGTGAFGAVTTFPIVPDGIAATATDLNNDGILDVVTAGYSGSLLGVAMGAGGGTFGNVQYYFTNAGTSALTTADLNNDGRVDIIHGQGVFTPSCYTRVFLNP